MPACCKLAVLDQHMHMPIFVNTFFQAGRHLLRLRCMLVQFAEGNLCCWCDRCSMHWQTPMPRPRLRPWLPLRQCLRTHPACLADASTACRILLSLSKALQMP